MGISMGKVYAKLFGKSPVNILFMGLDAAGKTTMLYKMKLGEITTQIPTIGMHMELMEYKNVTMRTLDVGGRDKIRPLWRHFFKNTDALVFVVDSNDRERLYEVKDELHRALSEDYLKDCPFLIMANKQDLPGAMTVHELAEKLDLHKLRGRNWYIQPTTAVSGDGIFEGLDWLSGTIGINKATKKANDLKDDTTKTVAGKTITTGWGQFFSAVDKMRSMIWRQKISDQNPTLTINTSREP